MIHQGLTFRTLLSEVYLNLLVLIVLKRDYKIHILSTLNPQAIELQKEMLNRARRNFTAEASISSDDRVHNGHGLIQILNVRSLKEIL
jgi:hypothetical protein